MLIAEDMITAKETDSFVSVQITDLFGLKWVLICSAIASLESLVSFTSVKEYHRAKSMHKPPCRCGSYEMQISWP
jgi:hypothetical protein